MGRTARDKRDRPHPPPVERIELNQEHVGRRMIMAGLLLVFGAGMLVYAFMQLLAPGDEWITVEANSSAGASCSSEFSFLYRPGSGDLSYTADRKAVTTHYTELCREAFELFHSREAFDGVNNIYAINRRPNEILEVDEGLYRALSTVESSGSRAIYLGPVYSRYNGLFFCEDDSQLVDFDPRLNKDIAQEYQEMLAFANDPESVRVELLGNNQIRLFVSDAYLAYAAREEIEDFIDFFWMQNAFIADFLADGLAELGYTNGVLSSYDGFVRNLDGSGTGYSMQICDRSPYGVYMAALLNYRGPMSIISLRDYPANGLDAYRFYELQNGEIRTPYLDVADGLCKSAFHDLTCYAGDKGCGEILLEIMPVYIADAFQPEALNRLTAKGIESVYCRDRVIYYTDPALELDQLYHQGNVQYTAEVSS